MKRKWNLKGFKFHSSIHCKFNSCIFTAASTIRAQVRNIDCKMPWLLQAADLETENTESGEYLSMFLNSLLSGKVSIHLSKCLNRPRLAIDQNLYAISNRTLPKSVHFPYMIETLSNCKQLINITNWLGHGMSDSILEEMKTENASKVLSEMKEDCLLPPECKEWVFTMMTAANIDRNEETKNEVFSECERKKFNTFAAADIIHFQWEYEICYRGSEIEILIGNISCNPVVNIHSSNL